MNVSGQVPPNMIGGIRNKFNKNMDQVILQAPAESALNKKKRSNKARRLLFGSSAEESDSDDEEIDESSSDDDDDNPFALSCVAAALDEAQQPIAFALLARSVAAPLSCLSWSKHTQQR